MVLSAAVKSVSVVVASARAAMPLWMQRYICTASRMSATPMTRTTCHHHALLNGSHSCEVVLKGCVSCKHIFLSNGLAVRMGLLVGVPDNYLVTVAQVGQVGSHTLLGRVRVISNAYNLLLLKLLVIKVRCHEVMLVATSS